MTALVAANAIEELLRKLEDVSSVFASIAGRQKLTEKIITIIVDRENNNHPTLKKIGSCEIVNNTVYLESLINNEAINLKSGAEYN